ncbi:hypothetical protein METBIDRAFT_102756 [Metschnikowia bicuspidata var. bicuspidata NRRL YB-4993]|uniref:Phosphomethylpyrimidine kinase n=1 Tax=Metschnikowia bicuspidata var. bicuspidata NRRL YB-4993 TaxID=869754 RepID=A0A1A0HHD1_9ASCO|nr:hypothetical protein METBIDRAFT_102756 [Metschnikowia bicuspidata var. bicuspidata NRRL YB-4993]OBA23248.1 hypothetical protein METBIDRAFT_102756 [Metschnikowia bicuspidata var. bicuspidata NRRL YB-4993]
MTAQNVVTLSPPRDAKRVINAVLTIAGSDSSGGAGIEADIKTITAHKTYALTCITALTAQNTTGVKAVAETSKEHLRQILKANFEDFVDGYDGPHPLKVVKTGMLTSSAAEVLSEHLPYLHDNNVRLVVDPVIVATSGQVLAENDTMQLVLRDIIPSSLLCTPNSDEAKFLWKAVEGQLVDEHSFDTVDSFVAFAIALQKKLHCENLLVKGGHVPFCDGKRQLGKSALSLLDEENMEICDILYESKTDTVTVFKSSYIQTNNSHGTGCTLASAISANLANGKTLAQAVALSIHYIHKGMVTVEGKLGHCNGPLDHAVEPPSTFLGVSNGEAWDVSAEHGTFFNYFKSHPLVREGWERYTKHPFLELVATNSLPFDDFLYFLKQDFYYLVNYARVHGYAASVAPDCEQIEAQTRIIASIMTEIERHKDKLSKKYNIDYNNADLDAELRPGPACVAYCDYLTKIARDQDFAAIKVAVAPCLHGYAEAGLHGLEIRKHFDGQLNQLDSQEQSDIYSAWLDDYASDWYRAAHDEGIRVLDSLFLGQTLSEHRKEELCTMFRDVVELEVAFWDEVVDRSKQK